MMSPPREVITPGARYSIAVLTVLVLVLTTTSYLLSLNAIRHANHNTVSLIQLCQTINAQRGREVAFVEHLFAVTLAPAHETAAARARRLRENAAVFAYAQRTFAPADCHHAIAPLP